MSNTGEKTVKIRVVGVAPLLMHNGALSDPLNEFSKQIKKLTSKKKKTDDDHLAIARLEWEGSMYRDADGHVVIPSDMVEACLYAGAAKRKMKKQFKSAVFCSEPEFKLEYKGPKDLSGLWDGGFKDTRRAKVGQASVQRTRPRFDEWACEFQVTVLDGSEIEIDDVRDAIEEAGRSSGFGDYRPKFGRFVVEKFKA